MNRNRERIPDQEGYEIHFARGEGVSGGLPTRVTCTVYAEPDPLYEAYNDAATSMNVSIGAQLLLACATAAGGLGAGGILPGGRLFRRTEEAQVQDRYYH